MATEDYERKRLRLESGGVEAHERDMVVSVDRGPLLSGVIRSFVQLARLISFLGPENAKRYKISAYRTMVFLGRRLESCSGRP